MIPPAYAPWLLLLLGLVIVSALARRVPVLRWLLSIASWGLVLWLLLPVLAQYAQFDPRLAKLASLIETERQQVVGGEVHIPLARDGHFWARVRLNGVERRMLIDSGATVTALSAETAQAAGLTVRQPLVPMLLRTANGTIAAETTSIPELRIGSIQAQGLHAVVSPAFGGLDVLGMNFLSMLKSWRVEDNVLILEPHHPVPADPHGA